MTIDSIKLAAMHNEITDLQLQIKRLQRRKRLLLQKLYTKRWRERDSKNKACTPLPNLKSPCTKLIIPKLAQNQSRAR